MRIENWSLFNTNIQLTGTYVLLPKCISYNFNLKISKGKNSKSLQICQGFAKDHSKMTYFKNLMNLSSIH